MTAIKLYEEEVILSTEERQTLDRLVFSNPVPERTSSNQFVDSLLAKLNASPEILLRNDAFAFLSDDQRTEVLESYVAGLVKKRDFRAAKAAAERASLVLGKETKEYLTAREFEEIDRMVKEWDLVGMMELYANSENDRFGRLVQGALQEKVADAVTAPLKPEKLMHGTKAVDAFLDSLELAKNVGILQEIDNEAYEALNPDEDEDGDQLMIEGVNRSNVMNRLQRFARGTGSAIITDLARLDHDTLEIFLAIDERYSRLMEGFSYITELDEKYRLDRENDDHALLLDALLMADELRIAANRLGDKGERRAVDLLLRTDVMYSQFQASDTSRQAISVNLYDMGERVHAADIAGQLEVESFWPQRLWSEVLEIYLQTDVIPEDEFRKIGTALKKDFSWQTTYKYMKAKDFLRAAKETTLKLKYTKDLMEEDPSSTEQRKETLRKTEEMRDMVWKFARLAYNAGDLRASSLRDTAQELTRIEEAEETIFEKKFGDGKTQEEILKSLEPAIASNNVDLTHRLYQATKNGWLKAAGERYVDKATLLHVTQELGKNGNGLAAQGLLMDKDYVTAATHAMRADERERDQYSRELWHILDGSSEEKVDNTTLMQTAEHLGDHMRGKVRVVKRSIDSMGDLTRQVMRAREQGDKEATADYGNVVAVAEIANETGDADLKGAFLQEVIAASLYDPEITHDRVTVVGVALDMAERSQLALGKLNESDRKYTAAAMRYLQAGEEGTEAIVNLWRNMEETPVIGYDAADYGNGPIDEEMVKETADLLGEPTRANEILAKKGLHRIKIQGITSDEEYLRNVARLAVEAGPRGSAVLDQMWELIDSAKVKGLDADKEQNDALSIDVVMDIASAQDKAWLGYRALSWKAIEGIERKGLPEGEKTLGILASMAINSQDDGIPAHMVGAALERFDKHEDTSAEAVITLASLLNRERYASLEVAHTVYGRNNDPIEAVGFAKKAGAQGLQFIEEVWHNEKQGYNPADPDNEDALINLGNLIGKSDVVYGMTIEKRLSRAGSEENIDAIRAELDRATELAAASGYDHLREIVRDEINRRCSDDPVAPVDYMYAAGILRKLGYDKEAAGAMTAYLWSNPDVSADHFAEESAVTDPHAGDLVSQVQAYTAGADHEEGDEGLHPMIEQVGEEYNPRKERTSTTAVVPNPLLADAQGNGMQGTASTMVSGSINNGQRESLTREPAPLDHADAEYYRPEDD
ncbi:TPA: hypothetical protein HA265_00635 [Candidatus Woesearchaeota archaeon]|nr:hypothetical protein [Candidatus Woesearchaeota archaeon]